MARVFGEAMLGSIGTDVEWKNKADIINISLSKIEFCWKHVWEDDSATKPKGE
jgi:hypothetical protein